MLTKKALAARAQSSAGGGWNLAYATYNGTPINFLRIGMREATVTGLFFKNDGTKVYTIGSSSDNVHEYDLPTAWSISTASFVRSFSVALQETTPTDVFFKDDGAKMYIIGSGGDSVDEYNLSTAWNISTASLLQTFSIRTQDGVPSGIFFKSDGTKMYMTGSAFDSVHEYDLSTAWNVSTLAFVRSFSVSAQDLSPEGVFFKGDGTKMYVTGGSGNDLNEYTLSTAWNISTASFVQNRLLGVEDSTPRGVFFKDDGTKMYMTGQTMDGIYEYNLSTAWNISTASFTYPTTNFYKRSTGLNTGGLSFSDDGANMYIVDDASNSVQQFTLATAWNIATASFLQNFSIGTQEPNPKGLFLGNSGVKMYAIGTTNTVYEYTLSTAWNISTASFVQGFSVATQETIPTALFFKNDGTKMYVTGSSGDDINEYNLSTPWSVSTASFSQVFSIATQELTVQGLFFKNDGTKMYTIGLSQWAVNEYTLSTGWDVSTASFTQNFVASSQTTTPRDLFFKSDGTKMYLASDTNDVWSYDL